MIEARGERDELAIERGRKFGCHKSAQEFCWSQHSGKWREQLAISYWLLAVSTQPFA